MRVEKIVQLVSYSGLEQDVRRFRWGKGNMNSPCLLGKSSCFVSDALAKKTVILKTFVDIHSVGTSPGKARPANHKSLSDGIKRGKRPRSSGR